MDYMSINDIFFYKFLIQFKIINPEKSFFWPYIPMRDLSFIKINSLNYFLHTFKVENTAQITLFTYIIRFIFVLLS